MQAAFRHAVAQFNRMNESANGRRYELQAFVDIISTADTVKLSRLSKYHRSNYDIIITCDRQNKYIYIGSGNIIGKRSFEIILSISFAIQSSVDKLFLLSVNQTLRKKKLCPQAFDLFPRVSSRWQTWRRITNTARRAK